MRQASFTFLRCSSCSVMVQHCLSRKILKTKVPFENSVSVLPQISYPSPPHSVINTHSRTWELYIGSNDLCQVLCHHQMDAPSVPHTFTHLFSLFSSLEERPKNEAFRPLQYVIKGTSSHVLTSLWKGLPPTEANSRQGQAED